MIKVKVKYYTETRFKVSTKSIIVDAIQSYTRYPQDEQSFADWQSKDVRCALRIWFNWNGSDSIEMQQGSPKLEYSFDSSTHSAKQINMVENHQISQPQVPTFANQNQTMKQEVIQPFTIWDPQFCIPISDKSTIMMSVHPNETSRPCQIKGCYDVAVSKRPYCKRHSGSNRTCEHPGCTKCAQGATRFGITHDGKDVMI